MQVSNDPELLKLMMEDSKKSLEIYSTSNYWAVYEKILLPELLKLGLQDYRRRKNSILSCFDATDLSYSLGQIDFFKSRFYNSFYTKIPLWPRFLSFLNTLLNKILPIHSSHSSADINKLFYLYALMYGEKFGAKSINDFEASLFGNPEHVMKINKKMYTMSILDFYISYAYNCKYINFDDIKIMVELGSGSGKQIEVIKKLHPNVCFLIFEVPPQLYVCEQYLKSVFPGDVVSYKDTKMMNSLPNYCKGKIFIFGNWKFSILKKVQVDLFWNSASFQEMEPDIVANYLRYVNAQTNAVYLRQLMEGKIIASKKGDRGVLKQTTIEDYKKGLTNFKLRDISPTQTISNLTYKNSFWERI